MRFLIFFLTSLISPCLYAQQTMGLFRNEPGTLPGYILFGNNTQTYLIDNCGRTVNIWQSEFKPGQGQYLLPNGDLLRTAAIAGEFNAGGAGGRFERFNWVGELVWHMNYSGPAYQPHHDIEPLPNGNFLAIVWEMKTEQEAQQAGRSYAGPVWTEKVIEIQPIGANGGIIVWEWKLWDHLVQDTNPSLPNYGIIADNPQRVNINFIGQGAETFGNWIHLNAIAYHPGHDQIALSSRNFSEIWVIDHSTTLAEAAGSSGGRYGRGGDILYRFGNPQAYNRGAASDQVFFKQHDVRWVPSTYPMGGDMMVFNNEAGPGISEVVVWAPPIDDNGNYQLESGEPFGPEQLDRIYSANGIYSKNMSGGEMLPNGNIFICEGSEGRFLEVNSEDEILWEYINPVNQHGSPGIQGGTVRFNETFRATKYPENYPAFAGRKLIPGPPVELNPWENECYEAPTPEDGPEPDVILISGNPSFGELIIEVNESSEGVDMKLFDLSGKLLLNQFLNPGRNFILLNHLPSGVYFIQASDKEKGYRPFKLLIL